MPKDENKSENMLLLLSEGLLDLQKGRGNRDGLVQQIITYVRDGRTVTRKQWVRSEFAEHAKKNEENKKDTLLNEKQREDRARLRRLQESQHHKDVEDNRAHVKQKRREQEMADSTHHHKAPSDKLAHEYKKKLKNLRKKEARERAEQEEKRRNKSNKEKKNNSKSRSRFGQSDQTRADNKATMNTATQYTPPKHN